MEVPDLYAVLGVEPSAPVEVITSAFRRRARELRPDTRVDAVTAERFGEVRSAYETLRDPVRRAAYDQSYDQSCEPARRRARERRPARERAQTVPLSRPPRRYVVVLRVPAPQPPLRAGPVRWERTSR